MKRTLNFILALFLLTTGGCAAPNNSSTPQTLNVFAAASLTDAFTELGVNFETANPGVRVTFNFAGSQALRTQIEEGAPVDVFASANTKEMDALIATGYIAQDAPQIFLTNRLVVILPVDNPAEISTLSDLATPEVKLVLAAEEVPVGKYARQSLEKMNAAFGAEYMDSVLANIVSNEDNVKQVVAKVQLGEADAGIVYMSDVNAGLDLKTIEIPTDLNVIAAYPISPLTESTNPELAATFIEYVLSAEGQAVLAKWGFGPIP